MIQPHTPQLTELWACFVPPPEGPRPEVHLISFMAPSLEEAVSGRWGAQFIDGRALVDEIRPRARDEYVSLIARLGTAAASDGRTLRQALRGPGGYSRWWMLGLAEKDCVWETDQTYTTMLRLIAIETARDSVQAARVRLFGAPPALTAVLVPERRAVLDPLGAVLRAITRGMAARFALTTRAWRLVRTLRWLRLPASEAREVLLQGYWDWSVRPGDEGELRDRYFTSLPSELTRRGVSVGWLVSCETDGEPWQQGRTQREVLAALRTHPEVTILERYWTSSGILRAAFGVASSWRLTRFALSSSFRRLCRVGTLDLSPIIRAQLLQNAWGSTICRLELITAAVNRACRDLRPAVVLTFLELFLRARAIYAGVAASGTGTATWAAQHAGYSSDKTLGVVDAEIELRGVPDGCAVPAPDGIFVMGDLSRRLWQATGLAAGRVVATGGLRYQSVKVYPPRLPRTDGSVSILLACGMNESAELDLCDAAVAASNGLPGVALHWRDHPLYQFSRRESFRRFRDRIVVRRGTLEEDFDAADLVLFTHAGIAEEALLRGLPVWQWRWGGFNTSPFLDIPVVPAFTSVRRLRIALEDFIRAPGRYQPSADTQRRVLAECFGAEPAQAADRIATAVTRIIRAEVA